MWWLVMYEYRSQKELYQGLIPAMNVKLKLLKKSNYSDITRDDIWNYLKDNRWKSSINLTLADMVQDIIHTDNLEIVRYVENKGNSNEGNV